jgi:hypothetical protein
MIEGIPEGKVPRQSAGANLSQNWSQKKKSFPGTRDRAMVMKELEETRGRLGKD